MEEQPVEMKPEAVPSAQKMQYGTTAFYITVLQNTSLFI